MCVFLIYALFTSAALKLGDPAGFDRLQISTQINHGNDPLKKLFIDH